MPRKKTIGQWRNSAQLRGVRSRLTSAINQCADGAYVTLDIRSARNLQEICDQAIHTEIGHEPSATEFANYKE